MLGPTTPGSALGKGLAAGLLLFFLVGAFAQSPPDLAQAEAFLEQGKAEQAYQLLATYEFQQAGNVQYDYLLGVAALDSGKPDRATLAFERVLVVDPNFAGARLDMARAYYQLGDYPRAQAEFQTVLSQNPPPAARATIQQYLAAIKEREQAKKTRLAGYLEAGLGHDDNVNNSTSQAQVAVPALGNLVFTLSSTNVKTADNYLALAAGAEATHEINSSFSLYAGADLRDRQNSTQTAFNFADLSGRAGVAFSAGANAFRLGLIGGLYYLDDKRNRETSGVNGEWRHSVNASNQASLFAQYARYRFPDPALKSNSFNQSLAGIGWLHVYRDGRSAASATLFTGTEQDTDHRADGGNRFNGLRLSGQAAVSEKAELFASLGYQESAYDKQNVAFQQTRGDRLYDFTLGLNWHLDKVWSLRPQVLYIKHDSNIPIYPYDRTDVSVSVRRVF